MNIEPGSEWVHRDSLTLVTVEAINGVGVFACIEIAWDKNALSCEIPQSRFLRDYFRNEPVTRGLLERMGWDCTPESDGMSRADLKVDDEHFLSVFFADGDVHGTSLFSDKGSELILGDMSTLRDLLAALRALDVETTAFTATKTE